MLLFCIDWRRRHTADATHLYPCFWPDVNQIDVHAGVQGMQGTQRIISSLVPALTQAAITDRCLQAETCEM
jgi:hypothetical protein